MHERTCSGRSRSTRTRARRRRCRAGSTQGEVRSRGAVMRSNKLLTATGLIAAVALVSAADRAPIIEEATYDGIIHPVSAEFMRSAIAKADAEGAALIIFTL